MHTEDRETTGPVPLIRVSLNKNKVSRLCSQSPHFNKPIELARCTAPAWKIPHDSELPIARRRDTHVYG